MTDRVRELFDSVIQDPTNQATSDELEHLLREGEDWASLVNLLVHLAEKGTTDPAVASSKLTQAAQIAETELQDPSQALELYSASLDGLPDPLPVLAHMRGVAQAAEEWGAFAQIAEAEAEASTDPAHRAELAFQIGRVHEEQAEDYEQAVAYYQAAFQEDSRCFKAISAARRIYRQANDFGTVAQLLDLELQAMAADDPRRLDVTQELANVLLYDVEEKTLARAAFDQLVRLNPDDADNRAILTELGGPLEAEDDDVGAATMEADASMIEIVEDATPADAAPVDIEAATDQIEALTAQIDAAAEAIEPSVDMHDAAAEIAAVSARIDLASEKIDAAAEGLQSAQTPETVEAAADRVQSISAQIDATTAALEAAQPAETVEAATGHVDALTDQIEAATAAITDAENVEDATANVEAVTAQIETALEAAEQANEAIVDIVADDPVADDAVTDDMGAVTPLADLDQAEPAVVSADVADQLGALEARAAELDGAARADALIEAVQLLNANGGGAQSAGLYLAAVRANPTDVAVFWKAGEKLVAEPATHQQIADELDALGEADHAGAGTVLKAHRLMYGAAHLHEEKADAKLNALARRSQDDRLADWQAHQLLLAGKWRNVQQILMKQIGGDPSSARSESARQMARLAEDRMGDSAKAADFWRQVFQSDRSDVEARQALIRLYPGLSKWKEYAEVLRLEVEAIPAHDEAARLEGLRTLVDVYSNHVKAEAQLVKVYADILEIDPDDAQATEALITKYEAMRKWPDLVALLERQAERADGDERTAINLRIADLYLNKFRNQGEAIRAYEQVLDEDPDNVDAIKALEGMYEKRRDWDRLIAVRRQLADMAETEDARAAAYKDIAEYATKKIRRPDICLELWEQVRSIDPEDADALRALVGFYEQNKDWDQLTETIDVLVEQVDTDKERVNLLTKAGQTLQDRLGDTQRAVDVWQRLIAVDPTNRRAGDALKKALMELQRWDELETFFGEQGRHTDLVKVLESQVGAMQDDATRIDLLFRAARIWRDDVGQPDRAVRALERVLQFEPRNVEGARALEPVYTERNDSRKLSNVLDILLEQSTDTAERRGLMLRLAELNEKSLRNPTEAFEWVRKVVAENPADSDARAELSRLGEATHQWPLVRDDLVEALGRVTMVEDVDVDQAQLDILLSLGRILDTQMGDSAEALQRYHDALNIDPDNREALDAVETLYERGAQWPELLETLDRKLGLADEVDAKKALLRKQGAIYETQLDDLYSAIGKHQAIVEEDASDLEALGALHRLYEAGEQYDDLHGVLTRELELAQDGVDGAGNAIDLKTRIAQIELTALGQIPEAVDHFKQILDEQPEHAQARTALEGLLTDPEFRGQAAGILEPIYQEAGEWEPLVAALEIQLEESDDDEKRVELLERIGTLHTNRTADVERAFDAFARMFRQTPDNRIAIARLTELADAGSAWERLAQLIEEVAPDISDDDQAKALLSRLAGIYETELDDVDRAIDAHRRVIDLDDANAESIEALDRLYTRSEQWPELLAIYRRKLELGGEDQAEAQRFKIANLLEEMLNDAPEAIVVYNAILEEAPSNPRALEALDRLYQQEEQWTELAGVVHTQLDLADDAETQRALRVRLAQLNEQELGDLEQAVGIYRDVLEADPDNEPARVSLERLIDEPEYRGAVANVLEPIYERRDDWNALIGIYEIQREESEEAPRQVQLLHKIAQLHQDRGGDAAQAFQSYARAFDVDPSDATTLAQLDRIAEALNMHVDLVQVYENRVHDIDDEAVATDVHTRAAKIMLDELGDVEGARGHYEAAYEAADDDLAVIDALDNIYQQTGQWHELVGVLNRRAELTAVDTPEGLEARKALLYRVCDIHENMQQDPQQAVEVYRQILELDADDTQSLNALERIFYALESWDDLIEVLQKKAALTESVDDRKRIYYGIAQICEEQLRDPTRAVETYKAVFEWDADDLHALERLDALYQELQEWDDLHGVLTRQVAVQTDPDARLTLRYRIARLHETEQDDVEAAIEGYRAILADQASHEPTLVALEGLVQEDREALKAAGVLEPVLTNAGAWSRQIGVWRALLKVTEEIPDRTALLIRIAKAHEDMLLENEAAFGAYGEAFREDHTHPEALAGLERVAEATDYWVPLTELLEAELVNVPNDTVARDIYLRAARIYEEQLRSNVDAIERYRRVLEIEPEHQGAILALDRLYQSEGMWADLADILQLRVEGLEDAEDATPAEPVAAADMNADSGADAAGAEVDTGDAPAEPHPKVELLLRLGNLYQDMLGDVPGAINAYRDVLEIESQQPLAVSSLQGLFDAGEQQPVIGELLEPILTENEDWPKLHDLQQNLLNHMDMADDRVQAMHGLAELSLNKLDDQGRAFDWYARAFKEIPEEEASREKLAALAGKTERYQDLVVTYTEGLEKTQDLELQRSLCHEMAGIYRNQLANDDSAEQIHRYVLDAIDPVDMSALQGLDTLYEEQKRWPELVDVLRQEIDGTYEDEPRVALMYRLGLTLETYQGDIDGAVDQYTAILDMEPQHVDTLSRLDQIYLAQQQWEPLFDVYARQAENAEADEDKAQLFARQANLASEFLERPEDAIDLWNQVLELRGEDPNALMALEGLYQNQQSWRELVDVCERQVNLVENDVQREIALYGKLGRVWGDYLERETNALENWGRVLDLDPQNEEALWAVRALHERTEDHAQIAATNHRLLELLVPDDQRRPDLFRQLGQLYQEELEQPPKAIDAWTNLLAIESHDREAIESLEELYTQAEDYSSCVAILDRKAEITEDAYERVSILFRAAEMWEQKLQDPNGAQQAYARVLEAQPDNVDAFEALERLYEQGMQWEDLVNLLLGRLEQTQDLFERQELFERVAKVLEERLQSPENAFDVLGLAFEETNDDERFGAELERLATDTGKWAELVGKYETVLQAIGETPESVPIRVRVAGWYDEKLEQPQHAGVHFQRVLAIEPDNVPALKSVVELLERYQNWPKVVEFLRQLVDLLTEPEERVAGLWKLAQILENKLDQPDQAIDAYRQLLMEEPEHLETLQALERLYALRQRWEDLIDVLDQQAQVLTEPQAIVENHLRVGELWESRLGSADRAIDAYNQALVADETCTDAMQALEKLYTQQERWHDLLDVYEMMLKVRTEPAAQLRVYTRIAMIQEENLSDRYATIDTYRRMVEVDPSDPNAVRALDRLYRETEQWEDLAEVYEAHLEQLSDMRDKVRVRGVLAEIYQGPLGNADRAIESLQPVLEMDPNHRETLASLGALYSQTEDWHNTIDALSREAHLIRDRRELLERQHQVGQIYQERLGDLENADRWYRSALEHDANYLPALEALKSIAEQRKDWTEVVRILTMMESATRSFEEQSVYLYEMGEVYAQHLGDQVTAVDYYEQAIDRHPQNVQAARPLVEVYWNDQRWERVEPLMDLVLEQGGETDYRALQTMHFRLAFAAEQLRKDEKAITHYRQAYEIDSTHLPTLQGMGNLLYRREDWDRAFKIFQTILVHHREGLSNEQISEIFTRQGSIKLNVGERRKALDFFRKALERQPEHLETLKAITDLHEAQGDWSDVIFYRRKMLPLVDDEARFESLVQIGDILHEQMNNSRQAVDAYNEAMTLQPGSRIVLSKLLGLHEESGNWQEAANVILQLSEQEADPAKQAKFLYTVGVIQRDHLKDVVNSVRTFDRALDADPTMLKAFQAIDKVLTDDRDYQRQDKYYRKMLKRALERGLDSRLVVKLADGLGEINRTRLKRYGEAVKAYKISLGKDPSNERTHSILAELYELEDRKDKAIAQHYRMITLNPRNVESYRQLYRLYMDMSKYDEAWCVSQVLAYMGQASAEQQEWFNRYRTRSFKNARKPLDKSHWALLNHPEKSPLLDQLFRQLYVPTVPVMAVTHRDLRLNKRRHLIDPAAKTPFNNMMNYAAQITRLQRLECYQSPTGQAGLQSVNLNPPAILVGPDVTSGPGLQALAFMSAKQLFLMSQSHFLASIDSQYAQRKNRLLTIIYTLTQLVNPHAEQRNYDPNLLAHFNVSIPQVERAQLAKLFKKMSDNSAQHLNLSKWLEMLEHTANRLGFLLANDLFAVGQVIKNEPGQFSKAPTQDRMRELILFALSNEYFQLRQSLGLAIG